MAATLPEGRTFPALLAEQALRYGAREAVVGSGQRLTYAELRSEVLRVARGLLRLGARRGDHIGILMSNRPEWIVSFLAVHQRSEEHTSELQSLMRISYADLCLKKKK